MAKYQAYAEYKDSGVGFLGEIPEHWIVSKVKYLAPFQVGWTPPTKNDSNFIGDNLWVNISDLKGKVINNTVKQISDKAALEASMDITPKGSLMYSFKLSVGTVSFAGCDMYTNEAIASFLHSAKLPLSYLYYALPKFVIENASTNIYGANILNQELIRNALLVKIPYIEAEKIANFLDHETTKIDHLIEKQQQLIELLKEKRQAVISYLVNVKEGEASIKLKYAVEILAGYSFSSTGFKTDSNDGVALLRGINVGVGNIKWDECVWWSKSDTEGLERYILKKGDLVFGMDRPWISTGARVAEIQEYDLPSYLVQRVARVRALRGFYQPYIKLILGSKEFKSFIESDLTGVSVPHISTDQIISFPIRKLYFEQQVKQTDQAIESINKIDFLIVKAESAIQLMQERRTALISAVVTGKIDVRNWQAPTIAEADTELSA